MSNVIFAKMDQDHVKLLRSVTRARGENVSTFVRRAVLCELARLSYLNEDEKIGLDFIKRFIGNKAFDKHSNQNS